MSPALRPFEAAGGHLPALQAHSSPHSHQLSARHRQIAQGKQRDQLSRVLGQSFVAHLGKAKLIFDDSERGAPPKPAPQKIGANALQLSSGEFLTLKSRRGGGCAEFP